LELVERLHVDDLGARQGTGDAVAGRPDAHDDHPRRAAADGRGLQQPLRRCVAGDDHEGRRRRLGPQRRQRGRPDVGARFLFGQGEAIEDVVAPGGLVAAVDELAPEPQRHRLTGGHRRQRDRRADLEGGVEADVVGVVGDLGVDDDGDVGAAVVDVVTDHQGARAGRRHPVDVAVVVTELVLAQRVERDVAGG
jgi:hypothetical protein